MRIRGSCAGPSWRWAGRMWTQTAAARDPQIEILDGSSDHLLLDLTHCTTVYQVGDRIQFTLGYGSMLKAFTSPYVEKSSEPQISAEREWADMLRKLDLIGVQSDWGASQRGASMGPAAIRFGGLVEGLERQGHTYGTGEISSLPGQGPAGKSCCTMNRCQR